VRNRKLFTVVTILMLIFIAQINFANVKIFDNLLGNYLLNKIFSAWLVIFPVLWLCAIMFSSLFIINRRHFVFNKRNTLFNVLCIILFVILQVVSFLYSGTILSIWIYIIVNVLTTIFAIVISIIKHKTLDKKSQE